MTVFNVAMPIKGQKLPIPMRKPGLMKLQCDAGHTWMNGWIYVFDHPYYAVTDEARQRSRSRTCRPASTPSSSGTSRPTATGAGRADDGQGQGDRRRRGPSST